MEADHAGAERVTSLVHENRAGARPRSLWILLILSSIALLASSVYRAATLSFGIDESLSFEIFSWVPYWGRTANNHLLNTALMRWCSAMFGNSELSLRLPNLAAHGLYLVCVLALVKRVRNPALQVFGFVVFTLNLLLAEYFFVARGYGLAVAFQMLSLYLFVRAYEGSAQGQLARDLYLSVGSGALAVVANFAWLNFLVPLVLASVWLLATDGSLRRFNRDRISSTLVLLAGSSLFLTVVMIKLLRLKRDGQLYWGGYTDFVSDTIHSLARCSLFPGIGSPGAEQALSVAIIVSFLGVLVLGVAQLGSRKTDVTFGILGLVLAGAVALPILEHHLFGTPFPIERAALYYLPLYAAVVLYGLDALSTLHVEGWKRAVNATSVVVALAVGGCFLGGFAERSSCAWLMDGHNREVLALIDRDRTEQTLMRPVKLRASHHMEPSFNFYRMTRHYSWLVPVIRRPIPDPDYIYAFESELGPADRGVVLASYPDLHTVLLRVYHAADADVPGGRPSS